MLEAREIAEARQTTFEAVALAEINLLLHQAEKVGGFIGAIANAIAAEPVLIEDSDALVAAAYIDRCVVDFIDQNLLFSTDPTSIAIADGVVQ